MTPSVIKWLLLEKACLIYLVVSLLEWVVIILAHLLLFHLFENRGVLGHYPIDWVLAHLLQCCHFLQSFLVELLKVWDHCLPLGFYLHADWLWLTMISKVWVAWTLSYHPNLRPVTWPARWKWLLLLNLSAIGRVLVVWVAIALVIRDSFVIKKHALLWVVVSKHVACLVLIVVIVVTFTTLVLADLVKL